MAEVTVRRATPDDAEALRALAEAVLPATYDPITPGLAAQTLDDWWGVAQMRDAIAALWHGVAEVDDDLVGVANLGRSDERWVMWKLYVHPDAQGLGVGTRLVDATLAQVPAGEPLWLEHHAGNDRAHDFYRSLGFTETHRETHRDSHDGLPDQVWMRKDT